MNGDFSIFYTYGDANWSDKLTKFNDKVIQYDNVGNPTSYDGWTYIWEGGRQLKRMTKAGSTIDYKYDADGIRSQKTVDGKTTKYYTDGGTIVGQSDGTNTLYFRYTSDGELFGLNLNNTEYLYITNLQGDVIAITDIAGAVKVQYEYDAWGKVLSTTGSLASTLGIQNPMRYHSYYLDVETGYYYLQSRYYDPQWKRFLNADASEILSKEDTANEVNLFAYCNNEPIQGYDPEGRYNRDKAVAYAKKWYSKRNNLYPNLVRNGNCANFVSQCLFAGGIKTTKNWYCKRSGGFLGIYSYDYSTSWTSTTAQHKYFRVGKYVRYRVTIKKNTNIKKAISSNKIKKGDLLHFAYEDGEFYHSGIINSVRDGKIRYSAQSKNRWDRNLADFFKEFPGRVVYILLMKDSAK